VPSTPSFITYRQKIAGDAPLFGDQWLAFNRQLDRDAIDLPAEAVFEKRLETLHALKVTDWRVFWLSVSRIAELIVKQAGDYADNCEFQAAGDLLVNPRRVDIHVRGTMLPVLKDRHCALSEQFSAAMGNENPTAWLSRETCPLIRKKALLPHLKDMLASSGFMRPNYLSDLEWRMCRIADTISFLSAGRINDMGELIRRLKLADSEDGKTIADNLCRFDHAVFKAMGDDVERLILAGDNGSRFLNRWPIACSG
jgi:hypothetical protein